MAKFTFTFEREVHRWIKDTYEIEAETLEEATTLLEDNDYLVDEMDEAEAVAYSEESDRNNGGEFDRTPQHTIVTDEEGNEIFDGCL